MKFFDAFTGIGGFTLGIENAGLGWECVGYSEIDKYASAIYTYHYPNHQNYGNITAVIGPELPDFNLLVAGFPCQAFSIAGKRQGFEDTRGTLFFDVARILSTKRPKWVILENVKGLLNHDFGKTIRTIYRVLTKLGYTVGWEILNSCHFGIPQSRERIFIVGHLGGGSIAKIFPIGKSNRLPSQGKLTEKHNVDIVSIGTLRTHKNGKGFREIKSGLAPTLPARAREDGSGQPVIKAVLTPDRLEKRQDGRRFKKDGEPMFTFTSQDRHGIKYDNHIRRLTPVECERLQGFPDGWTKFGMFDGERKSISDAQRYKTLGNAVTINVIQAIVLKISKFNQDIGEVA